MNNPFVDLRPLVFSEQCVIVVGAGSPDCNGTYLYAGQYNSRPVFYKDKNAVLYWDGASWVLGRDGDDQYFGTATPHPWQATWTRGEGSLPVPIVRQGTVHDFEREIGKRNDPTLRGSAAEKNVGTGPDDVAAGDHTHTIADTSGLQDALTQKADLVNGTIPSSQLPPLNFQTTRHTGDGLTSAFQPPGTLTASDSPSALSVTINGVTQEPGSDYTLNVATNRVVLTSPLPLGDKIVITRPILLPSNSTLTAEQLGALTATSVIDGGSF